jgi:hypothetical protein
MPTYRIINKDGIVEAEVIGSNSLALSSAHHYYSVYRQDGDCQLKADKKILIDYSEA